LLASIAIALPPLLVAPSKWLMRIPIFAIVLGLIAIVLYLPGYSSVWFPFLWAAVLCCVTVMGSREAAPPLASSES
jgi:hypothetical protein